MSSILRFISRPGTETHTKLVALRARMEELDRITNDFRKAQGWGPLVLIPSGRVAGGLYGIAFPEPPKDWRYIGTYADSDEAEGHKYYWPIKGRKSTRDFLPQLEALPQMGNREYNQSIGADTPWSHFGLALGPDNTFLLQIYESMQYTATDLEEITSKHYNELVEQAKMKKVDEPAV